MKAKGISKAPKGLRTGLAVEALQIVVAHNCGLVGQISEQDRVTVCNYVLAARDLKEIYEQKIAAMTPTPKRKK